MPDSTNLSHRYWVFAFSEYYPCGGLGDVIHTTDDESDAMDVATNWIADFVYVFDSVERTKVEVKWYA